MFLTRHWEEQLYYTYVMNKEREHGVRSGIWTPKLGEQQNQETSKEEEHQVMSKPKRPKVKLEGHVRENFKNFEQRFNDY